ncbi:MAG: hypothetical protein J6A47_03115 [Bacilli bacterium]|nr:hypothetical protein [Bacilli bacterium]
MKNKAITTLMGLACIGAMLSCGESVAPASTPAPSAVSGVVSDESSAPIFNDAYTDIDAIALESGEYMVADTVYAFDKANKRIAVAKYADYDAYKAKQGTSLFDGAVRFVKVTSMMLGTFDAVYFEIGDTIYLLHRDASNRICVSTRSGTAWSTSGAVAVSEIPLFSMGNYVSDKQTQNKADEQGNYIYDSAGGTIREEFYLFLELTETKASIYLSDNPTTHGETPLHFVENYKTRIVSGKLQIKIPHKDGDFDCSLTSHSENEIKFVNSMERKGDYSCSGTFTKIAK